MPDRKTILLVEDEAIIRMNETRMLKEQGYEVTGVSSGEKAVSAIKDGHNADLVLMDLNLGKGIDGTEAAQEILRERDIPIIFLSVHTERDIVEKTKGISSYGYVVKDSGIAVLDASIKMAFSLYEARKELIASKEAIRRSEEKYRDIFENALEGIFQATLEGSFISVNPALARIYGFDSPYELIDSVCDISNQLYRNPEDRERFMETLRENGSARTNEVQAYRKDGSVIWISVSARLVNNERGYPVYYEGTVEDITKRKAAEMSLRGALTELELKNRELAESHEAYRESQQKIFQQEKMASIGQLAAGVAHEINNPTGFIISNLNSLHRYMKRVGEFADIQAAAVDDPAFADPVKREALREHLSSQRKKMKIDYLMADTDNLIKESLDGAERIKRIVQDLKSFSRADDAGLVLANLNESMESTLNIVWNELKYKATINKEYGEIPRVRCNPGQLSQVFMNILVNASHAIPVSGEITIRTWCGDGNVCVAISDTGMGMPEDLMKRIFEPFFTTKGVGKGTGLGLSIAYDIVKKHNGEVEVASKVGEGTTFTIKIPRENQGADSPA